MHLDTGIQTICSCRQVFVNISFVSIVLFILSQGRGTENEKEINQPNIELESQVAGEIISAIEDRLLRTASSEEIMSADQKSVSPGINDVSPSMPKKADNGAEGENTEVI